MNDKYAELANEFIGRIEVKNLKIIEAMSEETLNFSCSVYVDGRRLVTASNRGTGGPNEYRPVGDYKTDAYAKANSKWQDFVAEVAAAAAARGVEYDPVDVVVDKAVETADNMRKTATRVFFRTEQMPEGRFHVVKWPELARLWRTDRVKARAQFVSYGIRQKWFTADDELAFINDECANDATDQAA